eukprot:403344226
MVEPTNFFLNEETFEDNKLMKQTGMDQQEISQRAIDEFRRFKDTIEKNGIEVKVFTQLNPDLPDSIFVNNWLSTHRNDEIPNGMVVLYPMKVPTREKEKNPQIIKQLSSQYSVFLDLIRKIPDQSLEGTGSLVFDYENRKVYVKLSARADADLLQDFISELNQHSRAKYRSVVWHQNNDTDPINHTNVVMSTLRNHIVLCSESIASKKEKDKVLKEITNSYLNNKPKELIDISLEEMQNHCGNILMLQNRHGEDCVVMSERARQSFRSENIKRITDNYRVISSDIHTIEEVGGGSARSMIAELF